MDYPAFIIRALCIDQTDIPIHPCSVNFLFPRVVQTQAKEALKYSLAVLIMFFLAISPWLIRNYHHFGRIAISSSGSHNLLVEYAVPMVQQKRNQRYENCTRRALLAESEQKMRNDGLDPQNLNSFERVTTTRTGDQIH